MVLCSIFLGLSDIIYSTSPAPDTVQEVKSWVPVIFALVTPIFFTINGILIKYMTSERINFKAT